ncbi:MAG: hypothetical protein IJ620_02480 [Bacteroidales bacterium]|nr:hypothetical protein [Bacteroidales bacterium]
MKTFARYILLIMAFVALATPLSAQEKGAKKHLTPEERMEKQRIKMVQELGLSDKEAEQFTVTFNAYMADLEKLNQKPQGKGRKELRLLSDKEIDDEMEAQMEAERAKIDLRERYYKKFRAFLSARQAQKFFRMTKNKDFNPEKRRHEIHRDAAHPQAIKAAVSDTAKTR